MRKMKSYLKRSELFCDLAMGQENVWEIYSYNIKLYNIIIMELSNKHYYVMDSDSCDFGLYTAMANT